MPVCKQCGKELASPRALNGHMTQHKRQAKIDALVAAARAGTDPIAAGSVANNTQQAASPSSAATGVATSTMPQNEPAAPTTAPGSMPSGAAAPTTQQTPAPQAQRGPAEMPDAMIKLLEQQQMSPEIIATARANYRAEMQRRMAADAAAQQQREAEEAENDRIQQERTNAIFQKMAQGAYGAKLPPTPEQEEAVFKAMGVAAPGQASGVVAAPAQGNTIIDLLNAGIQLGREFMGQRRAEFAAQAAANAGPTTEALIGQQVMSQFANQLAFATGKATGANLGKQYVQYAVDQNAQPRQYGVPEDVAVNALKRAVDADLVAKQARLAKAVRDAEEAARRMNAAAPIDHEASMPQHQ